MSLSPSTRLGPYEIVSSLGAGGMGEVYNFLGADGAIMAVPVTLSGGGVTSGAPTPRFTPRITSAQGGLLRHQNAVSADGSRFLVNAVSAEAANAPITVIVNGRGLAGDGKGSR
jgi:hypothetical protein